MLVKSMTEEEIYGIGHAFSYYDYGEETGMSAAFFRERSHGKLYLCVWTSAKIVFYIT